MILVGAILTPYPEMFLGSLWLSFDTDGHYSRPDVFELSVDARAKDGVKWR